MMNIVTGVFVESAMMQMAPSQYELAEKHREATDQTAKDLQKLFEKVDVDGMGRISRADFDKANAYGKMTDLLEMMGFQYHDVIEYFDMVSSSSKSDDNKVDIESFVTGCMHLRGSATSFDMKALMMELRLI